MKKIYIFLPFLLAISLCSRAQYSDSYQDNTGNLKIGAGFTHDFPGLNGYTVRGEFSKAFNQYLEGAFALQRVSLNGHPRTTSVKEYTKATTLEMAVNLLPVNTAEHVIRVGVGYSFSFYNIRRSYPVIHGEGEDKNTVWPVQDKKGRISGMTFSGEYEYFLPESNISLGVRASLFKGYDQVTYIGPFIGFRL